MANDQLVIGAGFRNVYWGYVDATGRLLGTSESLTAGDQDGGLMGRLHGAKAFPPGIPEPDIVNVTGDDDFMTSFIFPSTDGPGGVLELATQDMAFEAACLGLEVYDMEDFSMIALGSPKDPTFNDLTFLMQRPAKSWSAGSRGAARWEVIVLLKANCQPLLNDFNERTANPYRYAISTTKSDMKPWGITFGSSDWGTTEAAFIKFTADNPCVMQSWRGDGAQAVFNFGLRPVAATKCSVFVEGIKRTITTDYTIDPNAGALGTIDFVVPPGNNQLIEILFEYVA